MKTKKIFFQILLSYLVIMVTPLLILGYASFNFFAKFYDREVLNNRVNSLYRVQNTFDIFINQMNAHAYSLLNSTEFATANIKNEYGNFYDVKRKLSGVVLTNNFIDDVIYINKEIQCIFTTETVFDYHNFKLFGSGYDIPEAATDDYLLPDRRSYWLPLQQLYRKPEKVLTYGVTNKTGQSRATAAVFFQINYKTLCKLAGDSLEAAGACIIISDNHYNLLYSSDQHFSNSSWQVWRRLAGKENDQPVEIVIHSKRFIGFQSQSTASFINYVVLIPYQKLTAPIESQKVLFMFCMVAIAVLGTLFIAYFMKINYTPIRSLNKHLASIFGENQDGLNELEAVEKALVTITNRNTSLVREKVTLKLIRGGYASLEELEREGGTIGYRLAGPSFRVVVCSIADPAGTDSAVVPYQEIARYIENSLNSSFDITVVEYGEDKAVFVVVSGEREELSVIKEKLYQVKNVIESVFQLSLSIGAGSICNINNIKESFTEASTISKYYLTNGAGDVNFPEDIDSNKIPLLAYTNHAIDAMYNAIKHGQEERVRFAMDILIKQISEARELRFAANLASDIVTTALKAIQELNISFFAANQKYLAIVDARDSLQSIGEIIDALNLLTGEIVALVIDEQEVETADGSGLKSFKQVVEFTSEHLSEATFSVKLLANHFGMSISNFSHYFKKQTGHTVSDYIALLRFEKAKELLRTTDLNLQDIANQCGYVHISTFMRQFKRRENTTPANYRGQFRTESK